ncbi:GTPase-activating protein gyp1 [Nannizzia gypsea CBS 118893]|uniref:GTPase-activating protein gyp1 n=1 Tax=Arthroderma gypseum (strain ATCC MYA-4604 / CBS 118893) TaxID=535722 RepID=E4UP41_ARTGP|nr:GTPase-activating protein gyp1 [Nannizzia gypsea CBS 118893]EFQ98983.1 GTPase-activating protein gyp1 [Nannizzia gypsea CBS 118893]
MSSKKGRQDQHQTPQTTHLRTLHPSYQYHLFPELSIADADSLYSRGGLPFWRSLSSSSRPQSPNVSSFNHNTVVGASYAHTDMLKGVPPSSRASTPSRPSLSPSSNRVRDSGKTGKRTFSSQHPYSSFLSQGSGGSAADIDDDDDGDEIGYEDDEDEFGLPSVTNMRRQRAKPPPGYNIQVKATQSTPEAGSHAKGPNLIPSMHSMRLRANSADIAEERSSLTYPTANKSEGKILRPQYKDILKDPANSLNLINHSPPPPGASSKETEAHSTRISRVNKFKRILQSSTVSLPELRDLAWSGIPEEVRAMTWQLLLGYLPANSDRRVSTLERKRKEYLDGVRQAFERNSSIGSKAVPATSSTPNLGGGRGIDEAIWHQISIDIPRTNPHIPLYAYEATQRSLERILYVWAIRHPASGYVQGINDLVTPFWQVFLGSYITDFDIEQGMDPGQLPQPVINAVEADSFWCLTKLLDGIQDNYIYAQPGIHRQVNALHDLTRRIDLALTKHLENEGVEFMQFSFRWMNCLLMREISIKNTIRMWDTYMAEEQGFSRFHLYVCAAFLVKWSEQLLKMDFQEVMMFLQALPTRDWTEKDIELLLSEAFIWQSLFQDSSAHLRSGGTAVERSHSTS